MSLLALIGDTELAAPIARRGETVVSRADYLAEVRQLAARLPAEGSLLSLTSDRYRFTVGLGAAMLRGHTSLLPSNHTPDTVARLRVLFPGAYGLADRHDAGADLPTVEFDATDGTLPAPARDEGRVPEIDADFTVAHVLTSGSTGAPLPHPKRWGLLVRNARAEASRLAEAMGHVDLAGVWLVATVPAQHMYGFESTVLLAMLGGAAFDNERPFYPADIARALARAARPRMLVTTPFHLKMLVDAQIELPPIDLILSATAPLSPQLAARAEAALAAPLLEIYGCTEAGQVATRRTTAGAEWRVFDGLMLEGDGASTAVSGGHVGAATPLADVLEVVDPTTFRLLGRSNDLVNIAGKRSSLSHLNHHLNSIDGVVDGAFWMPPDDHADIVRLVAFVAAPTLTRDAIVAALRERVDAAFLPRRIVRVEALPRDPTGKLSAARLGELAAATIGLAGKPDAASADGGA